MKIKALTWRGERLLEVQEGGLIRIFVSSEELARALVSLIGIGDDEFELVSVDRAAIHNERLVCKIKG